MHYTIKIPGRMYYALQDRDAMTGSDPVDQAALAVFKEAVPRKMGHGHTFIVTGEKDVIEYILDYLYSLLGLVESGMTPANELGTDPVTLRRVANQAPVLVR